MSVNYHDAIDTNSPANAAVFNTPLGQLDSVITQMLFGQQAFSKMLLDTASVLTISAGVVTPTKSFHKIAAESSTTDDLDTITAANNSILFLKADAGDTITITSSGNITNTPVTLTGNQIIALVCEGNQWCVVSGSNNTPAPSSYPRGHISGFEVDVESTTFVTIRAGECLDASGDEIIARNQFQIFTGAAGSINTLDTGTIANNTWYYVWLCKGSTGIGGVLSTSATAPTIPSGYDLYKRRIGLVRTDGSANLRFQKTQYGSNNRRTVVYNADTSATPYLVANAQNITNGSYDTISCSAIVPPTSFEALAYCWRVNAGGLLSYRTNSNQVIPMSMLASNNAWYQSIFLNSSQAFEITANAAGDEDFSCAIYGYVDDLTLTSNIFVT